MSFYTNIEQRQINGNVDSYFGDDTKFLDSIFDGDGVNSNTILEAIHDRFQPSYSESSFHHQTRSTVGSNLPVQVSNSNSYYNYRAVQPCLDTGVPVYSQVNQNPKEGLNSVGQVSPWVNTSQQVYTSPQVQVNTNLPSTRTAPLCPPGLNQEVNKKVDNDNHNYKHPDQILSDNQFMEELRRFLIHQSKVSKIDYNNMLPKYFIEYLELVTNMKPSIRYLDDQYKCNHQNDEEIIKKKINKHDKSQGESKSSPVKQVKNMDINNQKVNGMKKHNNIIPQKDYKKDSDKYKVSGRPIYQQSKTDESYSSSSDISDNNTIKSEDLGSGTSTDNEEVKSDTDYSKFSDSICIGIDSNARCIFERSSVINKGNILLRTCNLPPLGSNIYKCYVIPKRHSCRDITNGARPIIYLTFNSNKEAKEAFDKISLHISKLKDNFDRPTIKFSNKFIENLNRRK